MAYDLVIRGGTVVDGSGLPGYRADVGIVGDRIATIGRIAERGGTEVDAEGHVVSPGFIDGHTHMDAQVFWDAMGTCSCWHGVTTVVMGNCGFTLAPCREPEKDLVLRNLERAEDIAREAMLAGVEWRWETFPEYLDAVDRTPKGINYAGYVGHSAIRTYVMGERAFEEAATDDDLAAMRREVEASVRAGAMGFTTSRSSLHTTSDDRPVASRIAAWDEVRALVGVLGELGTGSFELANEHPILDPEQRAEYLGRLRDLAVETGRPVMFNCIVSGFDPELWKAYVGLFDEAAAVGGRIMGQVHTRELMIVFGFRVNLPFDWLPGWQALRARPLDEQRAALLDPERRQRLVDEAMEGGFRQPLGAEAKSPFDRIRVLDGGAQPTIAEVARQRGTTPVDVMVDLSLEAGFDRYFVQPIANHDLDAVLQMLRHPRTVVAASDSGAHVSQIIDASIPTHLLAHWVRDRQEFTLEQGVRMLTFDPALAWGFNDRGLLREGFAADVTIFDPDQVGPGLPTAANDLPAGARRLVEKATGIRATVVNGQVLVRHGEATGALPGRLLRGPLA